MSDEKHFFQERVVLTPHMIPAITENNDYEPEFAFAEFIDNSIQSYRDHQNELMKAGVLNLEIDITWDSEKVVVTDNAFGMNHENFTRALNLDDPHPVPHQFNEYGMGLKNAGGHFGSLRVIDTTEFGSGVEFFGTTDLDYLRTQRDPDAKVYYKDTYWVSVPKTKHGTTITITRLKAKPAGTAAAVVVDKLSRIYSRLITREGLIIRFNGEPLKGYHAVYWKDKDTGEDYCRYFSTQVLYEGKSYPVSGEVGILNVSEPKTAGFCLLRNGRAAEIGFRPSAIFTSPNSFKYQRLYGEIDVTSFEVTFNKQKINWSSGLKLAFIEKIKNLPEIKYLMTKASKLRKNSAISKDKEKKVAKALKEGFQNADHVPPAKQLELQEALKTPPVEVAVEKLDDDLSFPIPYGGVDYSFEVKFADKDNEIKSIDWISTKMVNEDKHQYLVNVRLDSPLSTLFPQTNKGLYALGLLASSIALAQICSKKAGFSNSQAFVDKLNDIVDRISTGKK
jgi:hypothetical protein